MSLTVSPGPLIRLFAAASLSPTSSFFGSWESACLLRLQPNIQVCTYVYVQSTDRKIKPEKKPGQINIKLKPVSLHRNTTNPRVKRTHNATYPEKTLRNSGRWLGYRRERWAVRKQSRLLGIRFVDPN